MSDVDLARNCCMARMLLGEVEVRCRNEQVCQGVKCIAL